MADTIKSVDVPEVHGLVALNPDGTAIGTPVGGATASNQTNGSQKTQIVDAGGEAATVTDGKLDVNATASLAGQSIPASGATEAVAVQIVDGSGDQIASFGGGTQYADGDANATPTGTVAMGTDGSNVFALTSDADGHLQVDVLSGGGGGTQYTEGDTDATITGTAMMMEGAGNALVAAPGTASDGLLVNLGTNNDVTVGGTVTVDGSGVTQPVSGTVTANLSATDNAVLDQIELNTDDLLTTTDFNAVFGTAGSADSQVMSVQGIASMTPILTDGSATTQPISAASLPLPTGASTSTNQSTIIGHLDGVEGLLTTIDSDTGNVSTKIDTIAGAVSGTEMQVDVLTMPTVTVTATNLDVQSGGADLVTSSQGSAIQTAVELIDDSIKTDDSGFTPATDKVMMIGAQFDAVSPDSVDEGDAGAIRMTGDRSLHISIRDTAGNNRGANVDANGRLTVATTSASNETTTKEVVGDAAVDAALSGNPVNIGGRASTATPTAVSADNDVQSIWLTRNGAVNIADAGGSITIDNNALTELEAAIDTEVQVDIVGSLPAGTNAIGKLSANSGVDIGDVDVTSQPARDRLTDNIGVAIQTDVILSDTTALTPKFAVIDHATSGDNTIVSAVASKKIRVLACFLVASGSVNARFESGASGTALTGQMNLTTNSGFVLPFNPVGWFETASNTLLNLELSGAVSVDGSIVYVEV